MKSLILLNLEMATQPWWKYLRKDSLQSTLIFILMALLTICVMHASKWFAQSSFCFIFSDKCMYKYVCVYIYGVCVKYRNTFLVPCRSMYIKCVCISFCRYVDKNICIYIMLVLYTPTCLMTSKWGYRGNLGPLPVIKITGLKILSQD